jgi:hypothetical protein
MARTPIELPFSRGTPSGIIQVAGAESAGAVCPGKVSPGCLVPFNLAATIDAATTLASGIRALVDPNQSMIPLLMQLDEADDLTFELESGETSKTINAEGDQISGVYTPADFSAARLFAQQNPLPSTGPVRVSDVEQSQQRIVDIVRRLEDSGEIIIAGRGGESDMIV